MIKYDYEFLGKLNLPQEKTISIPESQIEITKSLKPQEEKKEIPEVKSLSSELLPSKKDGGSSEPIPTVASTAESKSVESKKDIKDYLITYHIEIMLGLIIVLLLYLIWGVK